MQIPRKQDSINNNFTTYLLSKMPYIHNHTGSLHLHNWYTNFRYATNTALNKVRRSP